MGMKYPLKEVVAVAQFIILDDNMIAHTEHIEASDSLRFHTADQITYCAEATQEVDLAACPIVIQAHIPGVSQMQDTRIELYMIRGMDEQDLKAATGA